ncbi:MAG: hypothetical protein Q4B64_01610 [Spirochaetales bacterium]|nr:hypothetical protein [Spirochaetales bacterium]
MKKILLVALAVLSVSAAFAKELEFKGNLLWGGTISQEDYDKKSKEMVEKYAKNYLLGDVILSTEKLTVGGKIYYRIPAMEKSEEISQRMEIKRAFLRVRPMGNELLEISGGKLYSYYLPGNFFQISETYTGASRWGESGVGVKSEWNGWTFGAALPVGESSSKIETATKFDNFFALNGAIGYDFSHLDSAFPIKLNADAGFRRTKADDEAEYNQIFAASVYYTPKLDGFVNKMYAALIYSYNAKPFVANTGLSPLINKDDSDLALCHIISLNYRSYFGPVHFTFEGEIGKSIEGNKIPVYGATQFLVPFTEVLAIKPRFMYYSAIDSDNGDNTRSSYEIYPRLWVTPNKNWNISLGADFVKKQISKDDWKWEWSVPFYVEYKIK